MPKRARYAPNHGTLATGIIHRRVFSGPSFNTGEAGTAAATFYFLNTSTDPGPLLDFGFDDLPRTSGRVWAAEVVRVNYQITPLSPETALKAGEVGFAVCTSNLASLAATLTTALGTTMGAVMGANRGGASQVWFDPHVIDLCTVVNLYAQSATLNATALAGTVQDSLVKSDDLHEEHDTTDTFGQGIVVFAPKVYVGHWTTIATPASGIAYAAAVEVYFRYVEVPLEVYLSKQQDVGLINT